MMSSSSISVDCYAQPSHIFQDYRHFAADVIAGGILGTTVTYLCFIQYYNVNLFNPYGYVKAKSKNNNND